MTTLQKINEASPHIEKAAAVARALRHPLRHPLRQQLLELIQNRSQVTVTELYCALRLEQSVVSQQLGILRGVGVVKTKREGKNVYYSIDDDAVCHILESFRQLNEA